MNVSYLFVLFLLQLKPVFSGMQFSRLSFVPTLFSLNYFDMVVHENALLGAVTIFRTRHFNLK
jgi:hypothetical protein